MDSGAKRCVASAAQGIDGERDDADHQPAPEGRSEAGDMKARNQLADHIEQECVDEEDKEAQRADQQRQCEEQHHGPHESVEDAQQQRGHRQARERVVIDAPDDVGGDKH